VSVRATLERTPTIRWLGGPEDLAGMTLLLVEDDDDCREVLTASFEAFGATVLSVASAREAVAAVRCVVPDLVVTDLSMPGEDGCWLAREISAMLSPRGVRVPIIACSGMDIGEAARSGKLAFFDGYISKPYDPAGMSVLVAELAETGTSPTPVLRSA